MVDNCTPGAPSAEICDGLDNDCDGAIDNDPSCTDPCIGFVPTPTTCGVGECASTGETTCDPADGSIGDTCVPGDPTPEVCDGLDNDCDGAVDEGIQTTPTTCGIGECASTGVMECQNGMMVDTCTPGAPSAEVCDGLDNDCDGAVDNGIAPVPTTCGIGECAATGTETCVGGVLVDDCTPGDPTPEVCDGLGLDEDCDGLVDDADPDCFVCNWKVETIRGGGQRPTTVDLQIQTQFTVLNDGCITASAANSLTVVNGTVLAFNCKVGDGPEPSSGTLDGVPLDTDALQVIICDETVTGDGTHKLVLENKGNGGKDTDRMSIKVAK
jgi:hypothetical protein